MQTPPGYNIQRRSKSQSPAGPQPKPAGRLGRAIDRPAEGQRSPVGPVRVERVRVVGRARHRRTSPGTHRLRGRVWPQGRVYCGGGGGAGRRDGPDGRGGDWGAATGQGAVGTGTRARARAPRSRAPRGIRRCDAGLGPRARERSESAAGRPEVGRGRVKGGGKESLPGKIRCSDVWSSARI